MPIELLDPDALPTPHVDRQVAPATGTRTLYVSGQVARSADGEPVGAGDLAARVDQALGNVVAAVEAAGGPFADVAERTVDIVDWTPETMEPFIEDVLRVVGRLGIDPTKAVTLLGVSALTEPDLLVEIEAVAVLP